MKKLFLLLLIIPGILFAGGVEPERITLAIASDYIAAPQCEAMGWAEGLMWWADIVMPEFIERGIDVEVLPVASDDNTTKKLDGLIAAGLTPNVYTDYAGRVGLYAKAGMAAPLDKYLNSSVIKQYFPDYIDMFTTDKKVYALPMTAWSTMGVINLDLLDQIGMNDIIEDGLTFDEVYEAGKALKALGDDYYGTYLFANQAGGDYWTYSFWLGGFGAEIYNEDGTIGLNSPEGRAALNTMKKWFDEGIFNPGAAGEDAVEYLQSFITGKVLTMSSNSGMAHTNDFKGATIGTPRAPGVKFAPVATGPDAVLAFDIGTEAEKKVAASLVEWIASARFQEPQAKAGRSPSMFGIPGSEDPAWKENIAYMEEHGVYYHGVGSKGYAEIRALFFPMIQAILSDELTVEEALSRFEKEGNEVIAR